MSITISGNDMVCQNANEVYTITPTPGVMYQWTVSSNGAITGSTSSTANVLWGISGSGSVSIVGKDAGGTVVETGTLPITVLPLPKPFITTNARVACQQLQDSVVDVGDDPPADFNDSGCMKVCAYSCITYYATGSAGSTYQWTASGAISVNPLHPDGDSVEICWDAPGAGTVTVEETTVDGCVGTRTICVEIIESPIAHFVALPDTTNRHLHICDSTEVIFLDASTASSGSPIVSWRWDFGDGTSSNAPGGFLTPIKHMYTAIGGMPTDYTATLTVWNACGCSTTETMEIHVEPNQRLKIDCPRVVCEGEVDSYFVNRPCPPGTPDPWTIIGGTKIAFDETYVAVLWDNPGPDGFGYVMYDASLCGDPCAFAVAKVPIVMQKGVIQGETIVCPYSQYLYRLPQWPTTQFNWSISTGTLATLQPTDQSNEIVLNTDGPGTVTITCNYYNTLLKCGGTATIDIQVLDPESIVGPDKACLNTTITYSLQNGSTGDWELTKPSGSTTGSGNTFNVTFDQVGIYKLAVTGTTFCPPDPLYIKVDDLPPPPDAIIGPDSFCKGVEMKFTGEYDVNGTIFNWHITDGTVNSGSGKESFIKMDPALSGPYIITLWREGKDVPHCHSDSIQKQVYPIHVNHQVTGPVNVCPSSYHNYSSTYPDGETYEWTIIDEKTGSVNSGDGTPNVNILWNNEIDSALVICRVRKCFDLYVDTLKVYVGIYPTPTYTSVPSPVCDSSLFTISVSLPGTNVRWDMGDGTGFVNSGTVYDYRYNLRNTTSTIMNVRAIVTDFGGCPGIGRDTLDTVITVAPTPRAYIQPDGGVNKVIQVCGTYPLLTATDEAGFPASVAWQWYLNGAPIAGATGNTYTPISVGYYYVRVTGPASTNCPFFTDTVFIVENCPCNLTISPYPTVSITGQTNTSCQQYSFTSTHSSTGYVGPSSWSVYVPGSRSWNPFSAGEFSATGFFDQGTHTVRYCAQFGDAFDTCAVCTTTTVSIPYKPGFDVTYDCNFSGGQRGMKVTGTYPPDAGTNVEFFVDAVSVQSGPSIVYNGTVTPGAHTVDMVYSIAGKASCTTSANIVVPAMPVAAFTWARSITCEQEAPVDFDNTSTPTSPMMDAFWDFGDGASNNQYDVYRVYNSSVGSPFSVKLVVRDIYGCKDSVTHSIQIIADQLNGGILVSPQHPCEGTPAILTYQPNVGTSYPNTYDWYNDNDVFATTTYQPISVFESGYYWVHGEDSYGCVANTNADTVVVTQVPEAYISGDPDQCKDVEYDLNGYAGSDPNITYQWLRNSTPIATTPTITEIQATAGTYTYEVIVTITKPTGGTCSDTSDPFVVTVHNQPAMPSISFSVLNCDPYEVELTGSAASAGTFNWSNGLSGTPISVFAGGKYQLTFTDQYGCVSRKTQYVPKDPKVYLWTFPTGCWQICPDSMYVITGPIWSFMQWDYLKNGGSVWGGSYIPIDYTNLSFDAPGTFNLYLDNGYCNAISEDMYVDIYGCEEGRKPGRTATEVAHDGNITYVSTEQLNLEIVPNPANNSTNIHYKWNGQGGQRYLEVYDVMGRLMDRQKAEKDAGIWKLSLDQYTSGVYYVVMKQSGKVILNTKLSIVK